MFVQLAFVFQLLLPGEGTGYGPKGKLTLEQYNEVNDRLVQARAVRKKKLEDERQLNEQLEKAEEVIEAE